MSGAPPVSATPGSGARRWATALSIAGLAVVCFHGPAPAAEPLAAAPASASSTAASSTAPGAVTASAPGAASADPSAAPDSSATASADPSAPASADPSASPPPDNGPSYKIILFGGLVSGAMLLGGGFMLGIGETNRAELLASAPKNPDGTPKCTSSPSPGDTECNKLNARLKEEAGTRDIGVALLIAGGVGGLLTALYTFYPRKSGTVTMKSLAPVVTPSSAGLVWTGAF